MPTTDQREASVYICGRRYPQNNNRHHRHQCRHCHARKIVGMTNFVVSDLTHIDFKIPHPPLMIRMHILIQIRAVRIFQY